MDNHVIDPAAFARRYQDFAHSRNPEYAGWSLLTELERGVEVAAAADTLAHFGIPVASVESDAEFLARRSFEVGVTAEGEWSRQSAKYREGRAGVSQRLVHHDDLRPPPVHRTGYVRPRRVEAGRRNTHDPAGAGPDAAMQKLIDAGVAVRPRWNPAEAPSLLAAFSWGTPGPGTSAPGFSPASAWGCSSGDTVA